MYFIVAIYIYIALILSLMSNLRTEIFFFNIPENSKHNVYHMLDA